MKVNDKYQIVENNEWLQYDLYPFTPATIWTVLLMKDMIDSHYVKP